jgi:hypothetical protein
MLSELVDRPNLSLWIADRVTDTDVQKEIKNATLHCHENFHDCCRVVVDSLKALDPNRPIREADSCNAAKGIVFNS